MIQLQSAIKWTKSTQTKAGKQTRESISVASTMSIRIGGQQYSKVFNNHTLEKMAHVLRGWWLGFILQIEVHSWVIETTILPCSVSTTTCHNWCSAQATTGIFMLYSFRKVETSHTKQHTSWGGERERERPVMEVSKSLHSMCPLHTESKRLTPISLLDYMTKKSWKWETCNAQCN